MEGEFYLTLPSNSSMSTYGSNTTTKFTTLLPRNVTLTGSWEMALVEIHFPMTLCNVYGKQREYSVYHGGSTHSFYRKIPLNHYSSVRELIKTLNEDLAKISHPDRVQFFYNDQSGITVKAKDSVVLFMPDILTLQLGFKPGEDIVAQGTSKRKPDLNLGYPSQIYVYCDIVEPQIIGDVVAPLLRIVSTKAEINQFGLNINHVFNRPFYFPVLKREFETVEIDLRTHSGHPMPFISGTSVAVLHFRQRRNHGQSE